ncbi:VOC family protein [Synechococcus sp. ATX 2A4]|nr:VOC family protein [Synechococcus sp. ATX 2A4]
MPFSAAGPIESAIVLAADDPQQLAGFYGLLVGRAPEPGLSARHWRLPLPSGGRLEIYAPSSRRPRPRQHGRLGVCATRPAGPEPALQVLHDWRLQLLVQGAVELEPARLEPFGAEAWMADPEGNPFLLLVQGGTG